MKDKIFVFFLILVLSQLLFLTNKNPFSSAENVEQIDQRSPFPKAFGFYIVDKDNLIKLTPCSPGFDSKRHILIYFSG